MEEMTRCDTIQESYTLICKANDSFQVNLCRTSESFKINNTFICKAHVEYIVRLSRKEKNKSLTIVDSAADTHVFGHGWTPLFKQNDHTRMADLIGFDESYEKKKGLPIGPHAALVKLNDGKRIILRAEHGVSKSLSKPYLTL